MHSNICTPTSHTISLTARCSWPSRRSLPAPLTLISASADERSSTASLRPSSHVIWSPLQKTGSGFKPLAYLLATISIPL